MVTKDPTAVEVEVQAAYLAMFPDGDRKFISRTFGWASDCFHGKLDDYQAVDAPYYTISNTRFRGLCAWRVCCAVAISRRTNPG